MKASYDVEYVNEELILLKDLCELTRGMSITNDAESVVQNVYDSYGNKVIFYIDTENRVDMLLHESGVFKNFNPGFTNVEDFYKYVGE